MTTEDVILDASVVREAVGVFRTRDTLEQAIKQMLTAGFDRSDIDILGDRDVVFRRLGTMVPAEELADIPDAPRQSLVTREDERLTTIVVVQALFVVGAFAGGAGIVASGGGVPLALSIAAIAGCAAGLVGLGVARKLLRTFEDGIEDNLATGGVVVWVCVRDREHERRASEILHKSGADAVRIHEIEITKRISDLPLANIEPDPLLEHPPH